MNYNPRIFVLWRLENGLVAGEESQPFSLDYDWDIAYNLIGREHHFKCYSNDKSITRREAIEFCKMVVDGRVRFVHIDLRSL